MTNLKHGNDELLDYLFIGAGASATLMLMSLQRRGLLEGKKCMVLDPDTKKINDKTYCFWATPEEAITSACDKLIDYRWSKVSVNRSKPETLTPMTYMQISSLRLYEEMRRILGAYGIEQLQETVLMVNDTERGVHVVTDKQEWISKQVFDSRPPTYLPQKKNESHLLQSFVGYVISLEGITVDPNAIDLMDFCVDQQGHTQFVYVLPYSESKMLVELTRFGNNPIQPEEAKPLLNKYILERFSTYNILDIEIGCIPMSNVATRNDDFPGLISIGGRAGAIKPSTGYAFKNMFLHAEKLCDSLQKENKPVSIESPSRFRFYDRLLLLILSLKPQYGSKIFQTLFKRNSTKNVLTFLEEKTSFFQDLRILLSLPIFPFIQAFCFDVFVKGKKVMVPMLLFLVSLFLWMMHTLFPDLFMFVQYGLFFFGLLLVGIPHGAVDHLLEKDSLHARPDMGFLIRYLGAAFFCLMVWLTFSYVAIVFFLIYSIWHFGQTDMQEWKMGAKGSVKNWIWGVVLFSVILLGHMTETNMVFEQLHFISVGLSERVGKNIALLIASIAIIWGFLEKRTAMVLSISTLAIGTQLPLISAFGLYFIGQHSINGWVHLKKGLGTDDKSLFVKALPFTLAAFLLFGVALLGIRNNWFSTSNINWITLFFVFISCISFPHVLQMSKFYKKNYNKF